MFHDDGYALLIGIDDYSIFDRSTGRAAGASSLAGSRNDAHVFFRLAMELGMDPNNVRVLASPQIDLARLPGAVPANVGEATESGIRAALGWLADKLASGGAGLLTYSGHGAHTSDRGLLICPSDVTSRNGGFDHAIAFTELRAILGGAAQNLTVVLDCCHASAPKGADDRGRRASTLGGDTVPPERQRDLSIGARVLSACKPGECTQQASFQGMSHGAFSWAIASIADQWRRVDEGGNVRLDLSYATLLDKARQMLGLLEFAGTPTLYGPEGSETLAVLQTGSLATATARAPDGDRDPIELDAGSLDYDKFTVSYTDSRGVMHEFLRSYAMHRTQGRFSAGYDYWYVKTDRASTSALGTNDITFACSAQRGTPGDPGWSLQTTFTVQDDTDWGSALSRDPYAAQGLLYTSGSLAVRLLFDATGTTITSIVWYRVASSAPTGHITPSGTFGYASGGSITAPAGSSIYCISESTGL